MKQKFGAPAKNRAILQILFVSLVTLLSACGVYTFRDVSIDYSKIKTFKVEFIENKAPYKNPLLSPSLTDALRQKITSYTKLTPTQNDDAHYQIKGYISNYSVSTSAISGQQAAANRLTVSAHMTLVNTVENKTQEFDVSRDFDFSAGISLTQAEGSLMPDIVKNMSDEIFNRLFSNW